MCACLGYLWCQKIKSLLIFRCLVEVWGQKWWVLWPDYYSATLSRKLCSVWGEVAPDHDAVTAMFHCGNIFLLVLFIPFGIVAQSGSSVGGWWWTDNEQYLISFFIQIKKFGHHTVYFGLIVLYHKNMGVYSFEI